VTTWCSYDRCDDFGNPSGCSRIRIQSSTSGSGASDLRSTTARSSVTPLERSRSRSRTTPAIGGFDDENPVGNCFGTVSSLVTKSVVPEPAIGPVS
jgi:hypothetical protein